MHLLYIRLVFNVIWFQTLIPIWIFPIWMETWVTLMCEELQKLIATYPVHTRKTKLQKIPHNIIYTECTIIFISIQHNCQLNWVGDGGGGHYLWWCIHKHIHAREVQGHATPWKCHQLGALRLLLRPYYYYFVLKCNYGSPTKVPNTAVRHDTHK